MSRNRILKTGKRGVSHVALLLVVVLYGVCTLLPGVLHALVHAHEITVTHSAVQESDACHRMLYHGEAAACDHDAHLIDSDECPMCDIVCHSEQAIVANATVWRMRYVQQYFGCYKERLDSYWAVLSSSRAPPARA